MIRATIQFTLDHGAGTISGDDHDTVASLLAALELPTDTARMGAARIGAPMRYMPLKPRNSSRRRFSAQSSAQVAGRWIERLRRAYRRFEEFWK